MRTKVRAWIIDPHPINGFVLRYRDCTENEDYYTSFNQAKRVMQMVMGDLASNFRLLSDIWLDMTEQEYFKNKMNAI